MLPLLIWPRDALPLRSRIAPALTPSAHRRGAQQSLLRDTGLQASPSVSALPMTLPRSLKRPWTVFLPSEYTVSASWGPESDAAVADNTRLCLPPRWDLAFG